MKDGFYESRTECHSVRMGWQSALRCLGMLLLIACPSVSPAAEVVQAKLGKDAAWTGEAVPLIVTLYSPGPFSGTAAFDLPELPLTVSVKSGNPLVGTEHVDASLAGRIFGFCGFRGRPVECNSEELRVSHLDVSVDQALSRALDDLARHEDITTGVILTPNSQYFPVSIERFIATVLEDEFSV